MNSTVPVALASLDQAVGCGVAIAKGQAQQVQRMRRDDLEPLVGGDQFGQQLRQPDVLADHLPARGSTPSMRRWNHSFSERKRRPSGTCQSR